MRVTNSMSVLSHTSAIQKNLQKLSKVNESLNTMKNVNKLSDDPYRAVKVMNMNNEISKTEKYYMNADEAMGWLETTESALESLSDRIGDIKKTLIEAGNGTYSESELKSLSTKLNENMKEIASILNTTHGGRYIFSGSDTGEKPVIVDEITDPVTGTTRVELKLNPNIDPQKLNEGLNISIAQGIDIEYNVKLSDIIPDFNVLNDTSAALAKGDAQALNDLKTIHSPNIDKLFEGIVDTRSKFGVRYNTVETMKNKNEEDLIQLKDSLSKVQDVDFASKLIELKEAELVYTASIQTGAKVLKNTILNYI